MKTVWQRNDGLVGYGDTMPRGFGDCSFLRLTECATDADAEAYILAIPSIEVNRGGMWRVRKAA